ncbi:probable isovaleryl-CoA dehydrogenase [Sporisorium reilianum f. sp. reilianum]|uniref:Probable isovaleryl-CoA dehydrogenase n=1 Tax=Sporisorium reilianum f. sp. reilianum TaxID=72559 RepID=A0A2N8UKZ5_9BASI|nr:probable isovaleryl-CoA dehydrogenase [Sporisorium reilianum f. sp. reilianum]
MSFSALRTAIRAPLLRQRTALATTRRSYTTTFYNTDVAGLTDDQLELRDAVAAFVAAELPPAKTAAIDRDNASPKDIWTKLGDMGLLGITVPEEYGGLGKGYLDHTIVMEELSRASGSVALSYGAHSNLCVNQLNRHGTKEQKDKYLPDLISGKKVGSLAMSEPGAGSDVVSMTTTAVRDGDDYILNGGKMWITNAPLSSTFIIYAKTTPAAASKGITAFIVERDTPGFTVSPKLDKVGMRGSDTAPIHFDNLRIPAANVLGHVDRGAAVLMSGLDLERLVLSGGPLGLAQAAFDYAVSYAHERTQFDQPIAHFQLMQAKIADMYTKLNAARSYVYAVGRACDAGKVSRRDCAGSILYSSDRCVEITTEAMQMCGGNGYTNDYPVARFWRDARLYTVGAGTQEIRRMLIGREFNMQLKA